MKITKLEIKSAINILIQINGEDQDMPVVEMELLYLYAMEEHKLEFTSVGFRELTVVIKRMLQQQVTMKDTDQPTKVNEQSEQQSKSYESDEEFQENNGQVILQTDVGGLWPRVNLINDKLLEVYLVASLLSVMAMSRI